MIHRHRSGFTLIELLVVVTIIITLATIGFPLISSIMGSTDRMQCASRMRQIGIWLIGEAVKRGEYPAGGTHPGEWSEAFSQMTAALKQPEIGQCPAAKPSSLVNPTQWAGCSYAYLGNLSPTYTCECSNCGDDPGKQIWRLYWSGVNYTGNHDWSDKGDFKDLPLALNLVWNPKGKDEGEPSSPTIPVHQDTEKFHNDDRVKFRTQRALREVPQTPEDNRGGLPLLTDIVVLKSLPSGASSWQNAHRYVSDADKQNNLYGNHCGGSASKKGGWGINILYADQSVRWKEWQNLRFQVMAKSVIGSSSAHFFY